MKIAENPEKFDNIASANSLSVVFLYTIACCVCALFFFFSVANAIFPRTAVKFYEKFGLDKASYTVYERKYERTGSFSDLYNLIQKSIEFEKHSKVLHYSKIMLEKEDFF